jgi:hypothetical protein
LGHAATVPGVREEGVSHSVAVATRGDDDLIYLFAGNCHDAHNLRESSLTFSIAAFSCADYWLLRC